MNKKLLISTFVALAASLLIFTGSSASAAPVPVSPGDSIQDAIDGATAGDTIIFAAGTYNETITIDKPLTLQGAQVGVDARSRSGAETIIQTPVGQNRMFNINSDDVIIDGFTFEGPSGTPSVAVDIHAPSAINTQLRNNVLTNTATAVMITSTDISGLRIHQNLFDSNNVGGQSAGIFVMNSNGSDIEITNNTFFDTDANTPGSSAAAINIFAASPSYDNLLIFGNTSDNDGGFIAIDSASNITIENNTATNEARAAITIDANVDTVTIEGNTLSDSLVGIRLRGAYDTVGAAPIANVVATNNTISGMSLAGVQVFADAISESPEITGNSIAGNAVGVTNASTIAVNAENNWWGCAAGPNTDGCDTTSGLATASVWYTDAAMTTLSSSIVDEQPAVPGVPNTGIQGVGVGYIIALIVGLIAAGSAVVVSLLVRRQLNR